MFTSPLSARGRAILERLFPQIPVDIEGDGNPDYYKPRHPVIYYTKNLLPSFTLTLITQLISAAVFCAIDPEWEAKGTTH